MDDFDPPPYADVVPRLHEVWKPVHVAAPPRTRSDYPCVDMMIPAFSRRAVVALGPLLSASGEWLPLACGLGEFYAFNITGISRALDTELSAIEYFSDSDIILDIDKHEFDPAKLTGCPPIFRIWQRPGNTYLTNDFVDRVHEAKLHGFHFIRVWRRAGMRSRPTHKLDKLRG